MRKFVLTDLQDSVKIAYNKVELAHLVMFPLWERLYLENLISIYFIISALLIQLVRYERHIPDPFSKILHSSGMYAFSMVGNTFPQVSILLVFWQAIKTWLSTQPQW